MPPPQPLALSLNLSLCSLHCSLSLHLSPWLCSSNGSIDCLLNDLNASAESRQMAPPAEAGFCTGCLPRLCYPRLPFAGTGMEGKGKEERGVGVGMGKEGVWRPSLFFFFNPFFWKWSTWRNFHRASMCPYCASILRRSWETAGEHSGTKTQEGSWESLCIIMCCITTPAWCPLRDTTLFKPKVLTYLGVMERRPFLGDSLLEKVQKLKTESWSWSCKKQTNIKTDYKALEPKHTHSRSLCLSHTQHTHKHTSVLVSTLIVSFSCNEIPMELLNYPETSQQVKKWLHPVVPIN